ncbi:hypothetical protein Emed_003662 [Eimeria media]
MAHFFPTMSTVSAEGVVKLLADRLVWHHELPKVLIWDRDPRFTAELWRLIWERFNMKRAQSSSWHPQTDGQTEMGDKVWGYTRYMEFRGAGKFNSPFIGHFPIISRVGNVAHKLDLTLSVQVHPVFHVSSSVANLALPTCRSLQAGYLHKALKTPQIQFMRSSKSLTTTDPAVPKSFSSSEGATLPSKRPASPSRTSSAARPFYKRFEPPGNARGAMITGLKICCRCAWCVLLCLCGLQFPMPSTVAAGVRGAAPRCRAL